MGDRQNSTEVQRAKNRLTGLYTYGRTPDAETEAAARRALLMAKVKVVIEEAHAARPALTLEQKRLLADLLLKHGGDHA